MVHSSLCNILPGSRKHYFHSTDWDLVSWPYLTAREAGIVAFMLGSQIVLPRKKREIGHWRTTAFLDIYSKVSLPHKELISFQNKLEF